MFVTLYRNAAKEQIKFAQTELHISDH